MYEAIAANKRRSVVMVAVFAAVVFAVAWGVTLLLGFGKAGVVVAAVLAVSSSAFGYLESDKVALAMSRAEPADERTYKRYHNLVEGLCIGGGLPKPRLYVIDDPALNAFATGREPGHAAVAVTTGLLEEMNRVELEAVLAHELSHVRNYDILVMTLAVTIVGMPALLSDLFLRWAFWAGMRDRRRDANRGPAGAPLAVVGLVLGVFAPIVAVLMPRGLSRRREYEADARGVQLTRYPPGLTAAFEKLEEGQTIVHTASKATAHLWIAAPLETDRPNARPFDRLFATHPPLDDRVARLREL